MDTNIHENIWKTYMSEGERVEISYRLPSDTHVKKTTVVVNDRHSKRRDRTSTFGGGENG